MLCWNVKALLYDKGIPQPLAWLRKRGMSYERARALLDGKSKEISLQQMHELCLLLQCTPNDLFNWNPEKESLPPGHPLQQLHKPGNQPSMLARLRVLNTPQLEELRQLMDKLEQRQK